MLGADPNRSDEHGFSPLHAAVRSKLNDQETSGNSIINTRICISVPEAGACIDVLLEEPTTDVEAHNDSGWTALHLAAEAGSFDAVRSLVRAGANVNNTDMSYGRTALHIAVEGGHKDIVEYLLKKV